MCPSSVVKLDLGVNVFDKLVFRLVQCMTNRFPFHGYEKGLHNVVVIRPFRFRLNWIILFIRNRLQNVFEIYCGS